jgi:hypothetical protein
MCALYGWRYRCLRERWDGPTSHGGFFTKVAVATAVPQHVVLSLPLSDPATHLQAHQ